MIRKSPPEEEFTGDVSYHGENGDFESDWALWDKTTDVWKARGRVKGRRSSPDGRLELRGEDGRFDERRGLGRLTAPGKVGYDWFGSPDVPGGAVRAAGDADLVEWTRAGPSITLRGRVRLDARRGPETLRAKAGFALVEPSSGTVRLKDGPPVVEADLLTLTGALRAERVMAEKGGVLRAHGAVTGWIHPKGKEASPL